MPTRKPTTAPSSEQVVTHSPSVTHAPSASPPTASPTSAEKYVMSVSQVSLIAISDNNSQALLWY